MLSHSTRMRGFEQTYSGRPSASDNGTKVTAGGSAHTLSSSYVELIASTQFSAHLVEIAFSHTPSEYALCNLYIGAAGSEQPLIMGLAAGFSPSGNLHARFKNFVFPVYIPAGSRISAKAQSSTPSSQIGVILKLHGGRADGWSGSGVEALGVSTGGSTGTSVTPGTSSEGSAASIGTSSRGYKYIVPMIQGGAITAICTMSADICVGGSPIPGLSDFLFSIDSNDGIVIPIGMTGRYCDIASGTALQLRLQGSGSMTAALPSMIYGVY